MAYRLYARSVTQSAATAEVCGLWRYISVICLCRLLYTIDVLGLGLAIGAHVQVY